MACYINKYINNVEKRAFFILLLLIFSNMLSSQEISSDTLAFYKAQQKIDSCKSGKINFTYNYIATGYESHCKIELNFIKSDENKIFTYLKVVADTLKNEYVFYNDTLLVCNKTFYSKQRRNAAFEDSLEEAYMFLIDGRLNLVDLLSNDNINLSERKLSIKSNKKIKMGEASSNDTLDNMTADFDQRIVLNNNNDLLSYSDVFQMYKEDVPFYKMSTEYLIDTFSLYLEKKQDIEDIIKNKYYELDSIITPNLKKEKKIETWDTIRKDTPKYAYDWKLPLVNADSLSSKDIKSKILVLDFYYIGCAPCILTIIDLVRLDSLYSVNDVAFVGVNVSDKDSIRIDKFIEERNIRYKNVLNGRELANKYGFTGFPQILFIDTKTNEILFHSKGHRSDGLEYYKEKLDRLLDIETVKLID